MDKQQTNDRQEPTPLLSWVQQRGVSTKRVVEYTGWLNIPGGRIFDTFGPSCYQPSSLVSNLVSNTTFVNESWSTHRVH